MSLIRYAVDGIEKTVSDRLEQGRARVLSGRVLVRAITMNDIQKSRRLLVLSEAHDTPLKAPIHEVVAVADDVPEATKKWLKVGAHVAHVSAAADVVDPTSKSARLLLLPADCIIMAWDPPDELPEDTRPSAQVIPFPGVAQESEAA